MHRITDPRVLLRVVAALELAYGLVGLLPPDLVEPVTGWTFNADGQWIVKLLAVSLLTQAWIAWATRDRPIRAVTAGLAFYQFASATVDWVMWLNLANVGVFANTQARVGVVAAIATHYALGLLLLLSLRRSEEFA